MSLRLMPEIFDSINVIASVGEELGMVDSYVMKVAHIESIVGPERVGVKMLSGVAFSSMIGGRVSVKGDKVKGFLGRAFNLSRGCSSRTLSQISCLIHLKKTIFMLRSGLGSCTC
jgi:hypothetical protein